ncbi:MAG: hypothetical protein LBG05_00490 [Treponema sp.]|nr:hypothetical protein [Treponema sp.]
MKKKKQDKSSRISFFCDRCGYEVSQDAIKCPGCGRPFSSVKCPVCNFVGEASRFTNGCPVCGYSSKDAKPSTGEDQRVEIEQVAINNVRMTEAARNLFRFTSLPLWIYLVTGLSLLLSGIALFLTLR